MVLTRSQYENMSKEELIQELSDINSSFVNDINAKLTGLSEKFNEFTSKYDKVYSELQQRTSFNSHLLYRIIQLDRNSVTNSQYSRRETIEVNPVPAEIQDDVLEVSVCKASSLTGVTVAPEDLHACHRMKRSDRVIIKFKCRKQKQSVMYKRKNLGTKSQELSNLKFSGRLYVSESMSLENQRLAYKCRQLKSARKIHSTWFSSNVVNIKLTKHGRIHKIFHVTDIENLLETGNLEEYINNDSF